MEAGLQAVNPNIEALVRRLRKRVKAALLQNLRPDEVIQVAILGLNGQAIVGTPTRLFVLKPGFMAGAAFGAEVTSWGYKNLLGIQVHKGMFNGAVVIQAPGQSGTNTSVWGNRKEDPYKAPNAIPVGANWSQVREAVAELQTMIDSAQNTTGPTMPNHPGTPDQLRQLAELHQSGALTDEEFAAAKRRLIEG